MMKSIKLAEAFLLTSASLAPLSAAKVMLRDATMMTTRQQQNVTLAGVEVFLQWRCESGLGGPTAKR